MSGFVGYNTNDIQPRKIRRACERCHSRKVRCDIGTGKGPCANCITYGDVCVPRVRRRKGAANSNNNKSSEKSGMNDANDAVQKLECDYRPTYQPGSQDPHKTVVIQSYHRPDHGRQNSMSLPFAQGVAETPSASSYQSSKDEYHNTSFISRSAILGDIPGLDHANGLGEEFDFKVSDTKVKVLQLYSAFDLPPVPVRQSLVEAFFEFAWPWMPVIDPDVLAAAPSKPPSLLLLQALFLAGSQMRKGTSYYATSEDYYTRTKALLDAGLERKPLIALAALCMIQWWNPSAPTDVSTNNSRFWVTYGIGLAQQVGLHRRSAKPESDEGLRRRIWWTLYKMAPGNHIAPTFLSMASLQLALLTSYPRQARDSMIASAHGRPRMINLADCTVDPPCVLDFPEPTDLRAQIFVHYVKICGLVCDLCQLQTRKNNPPPEEKNAIGVNLLNWVRSLPPELRLYNVDGSSRPYDFELVQLHVPFFSAICVFFRPRSVFTINPDSTAAVVASTLNFRLFEAFHLRDQTFYLGPIYAWHSLVAAIPQLSCSRIPSLWEEAQYALGTIEEVLRALGQKWPSAMNNFRNLQVLRKTIDSATAGPVPRTTPSSQASFTFSPIEFFDTFGTEVMQNFRRIESLLTAETERSQGSQFQNGSNLPLYAPSMNGKDSSVASTPLHEPGLTNPDAIYEGRNVQTPMGTAMFNEFSQQIVDASTISFYQSDWMRSWIDDLGVQ